MKYLLGIFSRARHSTFFLFLLNQVLAYSIPFNKPHRIRVTAVHDNGVSVRLPYKRKNLNHLKGIHACALATTAEYASGLSLLLSFGTEYRLIMRNLSVEYHYQARMDVITKVILEKDELSEKMLQTLRTGEPAIFKSNVEVFDLMNNHICTAAVEWQLKNWNQVKSK